jgi:hypothetical protein
LRRDVTPARLRNGKCHVRALRTCRGDRRRPETEGEQPVQTVGLLFLVEVRPTGGDPFRVELGMPGLTGDFIPPTVGQVVKMEVDAKKQKAKFDTSDSGVSAKAQRKAAKDRFADELGTPEPG